MGGRLYVLGTRCFSLFFLDHGRVSECYLPCRHLRASSSDSDLPRLRVSRPTRVLTRSHTVHLRSSNLPNFSMARPVQHQRKPNTAAG